MRWRVVQGVHHDKNAKAVSLEDNPAYNRDDPHTFYPGDVIETDANLDRFNTKDSRGVVIVKKFEPAEAVIGDELDSMTVAKLREFAAEEGVTLPDKKLSKEQLVKSIRAWLQFRQETGLEITTYETAEA